MGHGLHDDGIDDEGGGAVRSAKGHPVDDPGPAVAYAEQHENSALERESYHVLFPASGTYVGGSLGRFAPPVALPIYAGAVVAGHAVGRIEDGLVHDVEAETIADADLVKPLPEFTRVEWQLP